MRYDVIIIGAGYSGLAAGLKLTQAGKSVLILEARKLSLNSCPIMGVTTIGLSSFCKNGF